jgi:hypothetical protein
MKKPWRSTGVSSSSNIYSFVLSIECNDEKQVGNETGRAEEKVPDSVCEQRARVCVYIHVYNYTPYNVPVVVACKLIVLCCYNFTRRKYIYRFTAAIISPFTSYYVLPEGSTLVPHLIIRTFHVQSHAQRHDHVVSGFI